MRTLVFVRHGETELSVPVGRMCGRLDPSLTPEGRRQAGRAAAVLAALGLGEPLLLVSPLRRAQETAALLSRDRPWQTAADLVELAYGEWEGLTEAEIRAQDPARWEAWVRDPYTLAPPGGERGIDVLERVDRVLTRVDALGASTAVLVAHKSVLRYLVGRLLRIEPARIRRALEIRVGAVGVVRLESRGATLEMLNG